MANQKPQAAAPAQDVARVSGFKISAKRTGTNDQVLATLSGLSFLELAKESNSITAVNVESRDINKNPYLFSVAYFKDNRIEALYTYVPGMSPRKRRLDILRYILNLITLLQDSYKVEFTEIYQLVRIGANIDAGVRERGLREAVLELRQHTKRVLDSPEEGRHAG